LINGVDGQADDLHAAAVELRFDLRHVPELGGANRREVLGVGERHGPRAVHPVVEADAALGGVRLKIGGEVAQLQCQGCPQVSRGKVWSSVIDGAPQVTKLLRGQS
jgi:hypothetical protein